MDKGVVLTLSTGSYAAKKRPVLLSDTNLPWILKIPLQNVTRFQLSLLFLPEYPIRLIGSIVKTYGYFQNLLSYGQFPFFQLNATSQISHSTQNFHNSRTTNPLPRLTANYPVSKVLKYSMFFPPKVCIRTVSSISWGRCNSQERIKTILMQNFGRTNRECHGIFDTGYFKRSPERKFFVSVSVCVWTYH